MTTFVLIIYPLLWIAILAMIYFLFAKNHQINFRHLALYISFMAMLGPVGEIFVGTFYEAVVGQPLWQYNVFPTHNAYTSLYAPVIWGLSGAYLYFTHEVLRVWWKKPKLQKASVYMLETIVAEVLLNVTFLLLSGGLLFYYLPADLWHVTSLQTLPFYFVLGVVILASMKRLKDHALFSSAMCISLLLVVVYLT